MATIPVVVDLSHHNEVRDWAAVRESGIQGVIHKATQGTKPQWNDRTYAARKDRAKKAGLLWGAYHFATNGDGVAQAEHFLSVVGDPTDMLLCLDWEDNPKPDGSKDRMTYEQAVTFCKTIFAKTGQWPVVYGGNTLKELIPAKDTFFKDRRLWLCQYANKPVLPRQWSTYWLWQYTGDGIGMGPHDVPGITDHGIDLNVFGGTDLAAEWAPTASVAAVPEADEALPTAPMVIPAADPPKPGLFSDMSFAKVNDLADQGSRLAQHLRGIKVWFWRILFCTGVAGGSASSLMDTSKGNGHVVVSHPHLIWMVAGVAMGGLLIAGLAYLYVKFRIEPGLVSAAKDGRYVPRGAQGKV